MALGRTIRSIREEREISRAELARLARVTPAYISLLEQGTRTQPSLEVLGRIAAALGVRIGDLTNGGATARKGKAKTPKRKR